MCAISRSVAVVRGKAGEQAKAQVQAALKALQEMDDWRALGTALERLLNGERDPQSLAAGLELDEIDRQALAAVKLQEGLQALVELAASASRR